MPRSAAAKPQEPREELSPLQEAIRRRQEGIRQGRLPKARPDQLLDRAGEIGLLTEDERKLAREAEVARAEAIAVDSFTLEEYRRLAHAVSETETESHEAVR